jgi:hypothetical protein
MIFTETPDKGVPADSGTIHSGQAIVAPLSPRREK